MMSHASSGFTLIELMIVVAIIALLAAIGLPAYNKYRVTATETACLAELKNYANFSLAAIHNNESPPPPPMQACSSADQAVSINTSITGTPHLPGTRKSLCAMSNATCALTP